MPLGGFFCMILLGADRTQEKSVTKLQELLEIEGYTNITELLAACITDSVSPAICMNEGCSYTCEMEPDQDSGWCEECHTQSMTSALVLAGVI